MRKLSRAAARASAESPTDVRVVSYASYAAVTSCCTARCMSFRIARATSRLTRACDSDSSRRMLSHSGNEMARDNWVNLAPDGTNLLSKPTPVHDSVACGKIGRAHV